jgi:hypothetical protein
MQPKDTYLSIKMVMSHIQVGDICISMIMLNPYVSTRNELCTRRI